MQLIFVYNADSGLVSTVKDIGHKLFSPASYDCFLCSLTHGTFKENPEWRAFRENAKNEMLFLHRDEFEQQFKTRHDYPVVLKVEGEANQHEVLLSREQLAGFTSLKELIKAIEAVEAG